MLCSATKIQINSKYYYAFPVMTGSLLFVGGIISTIILFPHIGNGGLSCLSASLCGIILFKLANVSVKKPTNLKKTSQSSITHPSLHSPKSSCAPTSTENPPDVTATCISTSSLFRIPSEVHDIIHRNIDAIIMGSSNLEITIFSHPCSHRIFKIKKYPYFFKTVKSHGDTKSIVKRRFEGKERARADVERLGLKDFIIIPRAELFSIGDQPVLGVEPMPVIGHDKSLEEYGKIQSELMGAANEQQIEALVEFIIINKYCDVRIGNILAVEGNRFTFVDFDESTAFDEATGQKKEDWDIIMHGLFGKTMHSISPALEDGLALVIGIIDPHNRSMYDWSINEKRNTFLKIIHKVVTRHHMIDEFRNQLLQRSKYLWYPPFNALFPQ